MYKKRELFDILTPELMAKNAALSGAIYISSIYLKIKFLEVFNKTALNDLFYQLGDEYIYIIRDGDCLDELLVKIKYMLRKEKPEIKNNTSENISSFLFLFQSSNDNDNNNRMIKLTSNLFKKLIFLRELLNKVSIVFSLLISSAYIKVDNKRAINLFTDDKDKKDLYFKLDNLYKINSEIEHLKDIK